MGSNSNVTFTTPYPQIAGLSPSSGVAGTQVTISGSNFGISPGTVTINSVPAAVSSWSDVQIVVTVPNTSSGLVVVTAPYAGATVGNPVFTIPGPVIGSITPNTGTSGTQVTIFGSGFGLVQGTSSVSINSTNVTSVISWSSTQIIATVPPGTQTGPVLVNAANGISNNNVIFTVPTPVISGLSPSSGSAGTQVTITGSGFGLTQIGSGVSFTGAGWVSASSWSDTQIVVTVPAGAQTGPVLAKGPTGVSNNNVIFTVPGPVVTSISPASGTVGAQVTIVGSGFGASSSMVQFNGSNAPVVSWSDGQIVAIVPSAAASTLPVPVQVLVSGVASNKNFLFTINPPVISGISPSSAVIGSQVTISGTGFGTPQGYGTVTFNGVPSTQLAWNDTQIIAAVPSGAKTGPVLVTVGSPSGLPSNNNFVFTLPNPVISAASPSSGGYGTQVTVSGSGFGNSQGTIAFNGSTAVIQSWSDTQITTSVPVGASTGPIVVTNGGVNSNGETFIVPTPQITSISPTTGVSGTQVTITGSNFGSSQSTSTVSFNQTIANTLSWSSTQIVVTVPTTAITGPVVVNVDAVNSNADQIFTVPPPVITGISPTNGVVGTQVTITGTGFGATSGYAKFNGSNASIVSWTSTQVIATVASGASTGPADITVNGVDSNQNMLFTMPSPVVATISPTSGPVATQVTITGTGFGTSQGNNAVTFNGPNPAPVSSWSDTQIIATVPPGSMSGAVTVTVGGVPSSTAGPVFTIPPPQISGFSPTTGLPGQQVTIVGSGFDSEEGENFVTFNGLPAETVSWSDTILVVTVPSSSTTGPLIVNVKGRSANGGQFSVGSLITQIINSNGGVTTYEAGVFGSSLAVFEADGPGCSTCTFRGHLQNNFDVNGNLLSTIDSLGHTTSYTYDSSNNVTSVTQQLDGGTPVVSSDTYNSFGEVLTATDPLGNVTTNTYDANGNLLSVALPSPDGSTAPSVTNFTYDQYGELTKILDPLNHQTDLTYSAGLVSSITTHVSSSNYVTSYGYDSHGNRTSVTDAKGGVTQFAYDTGDRLIGITYPDQTTASFGYDYRGRRTSSTDQNGMVTTYAYDDSDRLLSVTDAAKNTTTYSYDAEDNLLNITDANGNTTAFSYDAMARVVQTTFPSSLQETYTYDAIGNLLSKTDRKSQTINYVYDALNRLTHKGYPDSTGVDYIYDLVGKVLNVSDPTGSYGFAYDNMGRLLGTTTSYVFLPGQSFGNSYTYDAASNRASFTGPDGSTNAYIYDGLNRLTGLTNSWAGALSVGYDALSRRTSLGRPNGVNTSYQYDSLSHLLSVLHTNANDGENYVYDPAGNRTSKQNLLNGITENYSYDKLYQLTQAMQGATTTESYTYDLVGNRISSTAGQYTYNKSNQLTTLAAIVFAYDSNGSTTSKTSGTNLTTYQWDFENRLSSVTLPNGGGVVSFRYDPMGRRIQKTTSSGATEYLYDGANIVSELNVSGSVVASYMQGAGIDEPLAMKRGGYIAYYHVDGLGSTTSLSGTTGKPVATYVYDAFGNTTATEGIFNPFRYTGREQDPETGLYYYRARYYDPTIGRFLSEDPVRYWGGVDFYKYVGNDPTNVTDPSGRVPIPIYGNWCGPDWTGGRRESYDPSRDYQYKMTAGGQTWWVSYYTPPINGLDAACETHDKCYYGCRNSFPCDHSNRKACMAACNHNLALDAASSGIQNAYETGIARYMNNHSAPNSIPDWLAGPDDSSCSCKK
jgi:RHS repeat-associated protein